jgi:hypothetical protein
LFSTILFLGFLGLFFSLASGIMSGAYICFADMFYGWLDSRRFLTFEDFFWRISHVSIFAMRSELKKHIHVLQ